MVGTALSRREVGTGLTGAGAALLRRRLDAVEGRLSALVLGSLGCRTCAGWPANAVLAPVEDPAVLFGTWRCRDCGGCPECHPRSGWPEDLRCPSCGREPALAIRLVYAAWPPGSDAADRWAVEDD